MGQKEIFEGISGDETEVKETPVEDVKKPEKKKPKRVLSEERKAQLREQLKRGRETSLANRKKKALVKSAEKEIKKKEDDKKIAKAFLEEKDTSAQDEIKQLREEMKAMKEAMQSKAKPAEPKNEKVETPPTSKPVQEVKETPKPKPQPAPVPQRKVFSTRGRTHRHYF